MHNFGCNYGFVTASKYKYLYNGKELSEEFDLNFYDYGARWLDVGMGSWWEVDPLAEKREWLTPFNFVQNNSINRIDPTGTIDEFREYVNEDGTVTRTKISDLSGNKVDFTHIKGGEYDGQMRIGSRGSSKEVYARTSRGIEGYTHREKGIGWSAIFNEFLTGTGPENSLITTAMTQELMESPIFADVFNEYLDAGAPDKLAVNPSFGIPGAIDAGSNWTAQMIGKASFSFYNLGDQLVVTAMDSKSKMSYSVNPLVKIMPERWINKYRRPNQQVPEGTTRQTYLMILSLNKKK